MTHEQAKLLAEFAKSVYKENFRPCLEGYKLKLAETKKKVPNITDNDLFMALIDSPKKNNVDVFYKIDAFCMCVIALYELKNNVYLD